MKFTTIEGRSGSGKTKELLNHINANCENLVITTEPSVYYIEKILAQKNIPANVIAFETLARFILQQLNVIIGTEINKESQIIMIGNVIKNNRDRLQTFNKVNFENSSINKIYNFIVECRELGITIDNLQYVYENSANTLRTKLHDILIILDEFNKELKSKKLVTKEDLTAMAIEALESCDKFPYDNILIDTIDSYSVSFKNIVKMLAQKTNNTVMAFKTTNPKRYDYFICKQSMDALQEIVDYFMQETMLEINTIKLRPIIDDKDGIQSIEKQLFDKDVADKSSCDNVVLHESSTMYKEIDFITAEIKKMINSGKYKPEDIIVTSSAIDRYINIIANSLNKHNIGYFYYKNNQLSKSYVYSFIEETLNIVRTGYTVENILRIAQFNYIGITREEYMVIDSFFNRFGYNLGVALKNGEKYDNSNYILVKNIIAKIQNHVDLLQDKIDNSSNVKEYMTAIMEYINEFSIKESLQEEYVKLYSQKNIAEANKIKSVWNGLIKNLNQIYDIFKEENIKFDEFVSIFKKMAEDTLLSTTQQYFGQVNIIDMKQAQNKKSKVLFVVGCNENYFPESSPNQIIVDNERKSINAALNIYLKLSKDVDIEKQAAISSTLAMPSEKLYISWSLNDLDSKPLKYASILNNVVKKFEDNIVKEKDYYDEDREEAFLALLNEIAEYKKTGIESPELSSKYLDFNQDKKYSERLHYALKSAAIDKTQINVSNPVKGYKEIDFFSVTRLESFNKCPFKHYIEHALQPEKIKLFNETAADKGNFFHAVMKQFFDYIIKNKIDIDSLEYDNFIKIIEPIIDELAKEHNDNIFDSVNKYIYESYKLKDRIKVSAWNSILQIKKGSYNVARDEYAVGREIPLDIKLDNGKTVHLVGIIDRIDIYEKDSTKYARIIDYKSGNISFSEDLLSAGVQLQLPLYSKAVSGDFELTGMYYFHIQNPIIDADNKNDTIEKQFQLSGPTVSDLPLIMANDVTLSDPGTSSNVIQVDVTTKGDISKKSKVLEESSMEELYEKSIDIVKDSIERILNGETKAVPFKYKDNDSCKYCQYRSICHFDPTIKDSARTYIKTEE